MNITRHCSTLVDTASHWRTVPLHYEHCSTVVLYEHELGAANWKMDFFSCENKYSHDYQWLTRRTYQWCKSELQKINFNQRKNRNLLLGHWG